MSIHEPYIERGNRNFIQAMSALFAGGFSTFAILYSTQPLMPTFSRRFHISPTASSLSLSVTTAALAVSMIVTAALSESWGRKRIMALSLLLSSLIAILTAFSPTFSALIVLRALQGVVLAGLPAIAMAYVNEEFHPQTLGVVMGMYISGTTVGGMVGRIVVSTLADATSWHVALATIGGLSLLSALWFWRSLPAGRHFQQRPVVLKAMGRVLWAQLCDPRLLGLYGIGFCLMGGFVTLYNYVSYLLMAPPYRLSQSTVGWIFIVYLTGTFSSAWMGRLADRHGRAKVLGSGVGLMASGLALTLVPNLELKIFGIAVLTFGFFGSHSVASGWVGMLARGHKAQASSLYLLFYYLGSSSMGAVGGVFWSTARWVGVAGMIGALLILALACLWAVTHFGSARPAPQAAE